jgi:hypothetical protein
MKRLIPFLSAILAAGVSMTPLAAQEKLRVVVETDAGGDPDDEQSLVRFLLYTNEWDVEAIIGNRADARDGENLNPVRTGPGILHQFVDAYGKVHARLSENAPGFPSAQFLKERSVSGLTNSDAGVKLLIAAVDRDDPRPVWYQNWGTDHGSDPSNLTRALDKVLAERGPEGYAKFKNKILLSSDNQFSDHTFKTAPAFRLWVQTTWPRMNGTNWYHRFGPITATAGGFDIERDCRTGHGPLGALYPLNTTIHQKEGDTSYFLYLVPTGMNDPMQPGWGSWGARFGLRDGPEPKIPTYYWANVTDAWRGKTNRDNTLARWAADLQNDFRARLDWCVKPFAEANHRPVAVLNGDTSRKILPIAAKPGFPVTLSAAGCTDPDKQPLRYEWLSYAEAGTYPGAVKLLDTDKPDCRVEVPADAAGKEIHIILAVRDTGDPPLTGYRRAIIKVD